MDQTQIWHDHVKGLTVDDVINEFHHPPIFQQEFIPLISSLPTQNQSVIEVGSETGVTSMLLPDTFERTLLDLNPLAIDLSKKAFEVLKKKAQFVVADMFSMPFKENHFDIVFNAGVIEHFNFEERTRAIKEYIRILKPNGYLVIAFPNHYSIPYRLAYIILNAFKKWPYPPEFKMYDLHKEIDGEKNVYLDKRVVMSKGSVMNWLNFFKPLQMFFTFLDKFMNFEGYLTVIVFKKRT